MGAETLEVLASSKAARAELTFDLARTDAFVVADGDSNLGSPDEIGEPLAHLPDVGNVHVRQPQPRHPDHAGASGRLLRGPPQER